MGRRKADKPAADGELADNARASIGANSNLNADEKNKLAGIVSEIEAAEAEKREIVSSIGTIYKTAKEDGFSTKAIKHIVKLRRMEKEQRDDFENYCEAYMFALGMLADTPLGKAAQARDGVQPQQ